MLTLSFRNGTNNNNSQITSDIQNLFKKFNGISFNTLLYLMAFQNQKNEFFEIYRKYSTDILTVSKMCVRGLQFCSEPEFIWDRRSNLTGAHFEIGVTPQSTLYFVNGVKKNLEAGGSL